MKIIRSIAHLRRWIQAAKQKHKSIGFVPTMGALHEGHLELVRRARRTVGKKGVVVVSIFVNPTQFNQKSDLKKYPRTLKGDSLLCRKEGVDLIFAPSEREMYAPDFSTWVDETALALPLCGASRPGHFRGVCTVVLKLFQLVQPDFAIFGQKDAQQALVIQRMIRDLNLPVCMVVAPIVREKDGLAMSSRNRRLSPSERKLASAIYQALTLAQKAFRKGIQNPSVLKKIARNHLGKIPGLKIDYLECVDTATLKPVSSRCSRGNLMAIAAFLGKVRLIDNVLL